ncbi:MAG: M28 family peptidase [Planctomycetota bacterium]|nr:M28 family peptidase [Planctomycetota bacterium]
MGFGGSRAYAAEPSYPLSRTLCMLNFDMIGMADEKPFYAVGMGQNPKLAEMLKEVSSGVAEVKGGIDHAIVGSDQWVFHLAGVPTLLLTSGRYSEYNTPEDGPEIISTNSIRRAATLWAQLVRKLDPLDSLPAPLDKYFPPPSRR